MLHHPSLTTWLPRICHLHRVLTILLALFPFLPSCWLLVISPKIQRARLHLRNKPRLNLPWTRTRILHRKAAADLLGRPKLWRRSKTSTTKWLASLTR